MKIYIPEHLRNLKIIQDLYDMILEYSKNYFKEEQSSFSDYYYYLKKDPVQKFLGMCITKESIGEGQNLEEVHRYISRLFYSVKGTSKVFEYMKKYLGLQIAGSIVHNSEFIEITLSSIDLSDEAAFVDSFREFLEALLYFKDFKIQIPEVNLFLEGRIDSEVGAVVIPYKVFLSEVNVTI